MIDIGQTPQHAWRETYCPSCGVPESAGLGQHGMDCRQEGVTTADPQPTDQPPVVAETREEVRG